MQHSKILKLLLITILNAPNANLVGASVSPALMMNGSEEPNLGENDEKGDSPNMDKKASNPKKPANITPKQAAINNFTSGHDMQNAEVANEKISVYGASLQGSKDMQLRDTTTLGALTDTELQVVFSTNVVMGSVDLRQTEMSLDYPQKGSNTNETMTGTFTQKDSNHILSFGRPVVSLGAEIAAPNYQIAVVIESMATGFDASDDKTDTNIIGPGRKVSDLYFQQAGLKIGSKKSAQLDIGVVKSVVSQITPSDKLFYRGADSGVFGDAFKYFTWVNLHDSTIDNFNYSHPKNQFFGVRTLSGDLSTAPKVNAWTPLFESEDGKFSFRAGIGASTTTDAQDGIIASLGCYTDFHISKSNFVRFSVGGLSSVKEDNAVYHLPKGGRATLSYHSKAFDVGIMGIYNSDSYVRKASYNAVKYLSEGTTLTNPDALNEMVATNTENDEVTTFTYHEDDSTGAMGGALQGRIALTNDIDLTLGAVYTTRNTGWKSDSTTHHEEFYGASIGINAPLADLPFRISADVSYLTTSNGAIVPETQASQAVGSKKDPSKPAAATDSDMILLSVGIRYNPATNK